MGVQGLEKNRAGAKAHERWHITSTDLHPASSPEAGAGSSLGASRYAVAFHGFGGTGVYSSAAPRPTP